MKLAPTLFVVACCLGVVSPAAANPFTFRHDDTIKFLFGTVGQAAGLAIGQPVAVTIVVDNGGTSILNQDWGTADDVRSVTFDFNNGAMVTTFSWPFQGGMECHGGLATTATGGRQMFGNWCDTEVTADFTTNGSGTSFSWWFAGSVVPYVQNLGGETGLIGLTNLGSMYSFNNWVLVETPTSEVPEPASLLLLVSGLLGAGVRRYRRRRT